MILRLVLLALLIVGAVRFPALWIVVLVVVGEMLTKRSETEEALPDVETVLKQHVSATDPHWRENLRSRCESPAEVAFLDSMINAFGLMPEGGTLRGQGITLDLQATISSYRVDFIALGWLVIEIDGAAWHSSERAIERDRQRDNFLQAHGYRVLRIPAKLVFQSPDEAVDQVRTALEQGKPVVEQRSVAQQEHLRKSVLKSATVFLAELNDSVTQQRTVRQALKDTELAFDCEKAALQSAIDSAERALKIERYIGGDTNKRENFDKFRAKLDVKFTEFDRDRASGDESPHSLPLRVRVFSAPELHYDDATNSAIKHAFGNLEKERSAYLATQNARLQAQPNLRRLVQANLVGIGRADLWELLISA